MTARAKALAPNGVKYPKVKVRLVGKDGNALSIIGHVVREMKDAGLTLEQRTEYMTEAMAGDYNHLLQTTMKYVEVS